MPTIIIPGRAANRARPSWPVLNYASELARGLVTCVAAPRNIDLVQERPLTGVLRAGGFAGIGGSGWRWTSANDGLNVPGNTQTNLTTWPITVAARVVYVGTPSVNGGIFTVTYTNADTSPYVAYGVALDGSSNLNGVWNYGGTFDFGGSLALFNPAVGVLYSVILTLQNGAQDVYVNGVHVATRADVGTGPTFGASNYLTCGEAPFGLGRTGNLIFYDGMIWNRLLTANERWMLDYGSPWDHYWIPSRRVYVQVGATAGYLLVKN